MDNRAKAMAMGLLLLGSQLSHAKVIELINTFPADGEPLRSSYGVWASGEWQSIAMPFHVPVPGRIKRVDTGIHFTEGGSGPIEVFVAGGNILGTPYPYIDDGWDEFAGPSVGDSLCTTHPDQIETCRSLTGDQVVFLDDFELYNWKGAAFTVPGDYWLIAHVSWDDVFGGWFANPEILSDSFATRSMYVGVELGIYDFYEVPWTAVADIGPYGSGGSYPVPAIRILFQPAKIVSEPAPLVLLGLGLAGLGMTRRRRQNGASNGERARVGN